VEKTDPINPEIEHANIEVVRRRWNDILSGKVKPVPLEEAFAEIDRLTDVFPRYTEEYEFVKKTHQDNRQFIVTQYWNKHLFHCENRL